MNNEKILKKIEKVVDDWDGNTDLMKPIAEILTAKEGESEIAERLWGEFADHATAQGWDMDGAYVYYPEWLLLTKGR